MRIGHGYDAHRFCPDKPLVIGGVTIPYESGMLAHSDGDVLIHALCDALLGAAGLGDIGGYYPDNDEKYKGIDSRILLRDVYGKLNSMGWVLGNADMTLIAQKPKMKPYIEQMKMILAEDMSASVHQLNIKATTTEGMGFTGRLEGIAAHAVVILTREH
jgi:2-C-methyl-D-erythritol 2,4-cyclodiphosphate synthase